MCLACFLQATEKTHWRGGAAFAFGMDAVQAPAMPSEWLHKGRNPDHVLNWLAECLCYWPVFPVGWNSEVGQMRRENGIGPEQPLTWPAKLPEAV